ncbi:DUF1351 domain-containing protein [Bacillus licheniformis]|nr:DUF1351 domain-containing protein [Bacillus licheniformis]MED0689931.1 DUF1351 domain-containing protein [Bacillus licheniformis]MED0713611.1 DUF1351 domain-containing protein [Bacillus licheniformis]MED0789272.1 DUF1351 domain-containing protein [Bacillus licheniformis]TWM10478.1 hypothetical protein CHCC15091_0975 [Bacillus licheniformis]WIW99354.1 DUF1351 domain-containing protein [Bacillus licheniformis]
MANSSFGLEFKPAELNMKNYDEMKELVQSYADKYKGLVFTRDEKGGANEARTELLGLQNAIEAERKNVKQVYNEPLKEFERKIKELTAMIDEPLNDIRDGLKVIEEAEKAEREDALNRLLDEKLTESTISLDELEKDEKWLNKGNWTAKLNPTKKLEAEIDTAIEQAEKEKERKESEKRILTEFCKAQDIDPAGWISQLEYKSAMEVIDLINLEKERKARLAAEQEQKRKEHEEFMAKQQAAKQESEAFAEQEQTVAPGPEAVINPEEKISNVIRVTGTVGQLMKLNEFLIASGIEVEEVIMPDVSIDDLPF